VIFILGASASLLRSLACGRDDRDELVGLSHQLPQTVGFDQPGFGEQFQPVECFVRFFLNDRQLGGKIGPRTSPACRAMTSAAVFRGNAPTNLMMRKANAWVLVLNSSGAIGLWMGVS